MAVASKALSERQVVHERLGDHRGEGEDAEAAQVALVPAPIAKGMEFDHVVVVEPADIAEAEPDRRTGLRRLYVVMTRAVTTLTVLHHRPIPAPLGPATVPGQDEPV